MLNSKSTLFFISLLVVVLSGLFLRSKLYSKPTAIEMASNLSSAASATAIAVTSRLRPVYFVSHGGPTFMYREDSFGDAGAFDTVQSLGETLLADPPKAMVVISAHWQEDHSKSSNGLPTVGITSREGENSLIYDFYGFPNHMYKEEFHSNGSKTIARLLADKISSTSDGKPAFNARLYNSQGVDHGLWVPLRVAFPKQSIQKNKTFVPFPIIQMSLPSSPSGMRSSSGLDIQHETEISHNLGKALRELRDRNGEDIAIVCSGMSVHNLRDLWQFQGSTAPYGKAFDKALKEAVENNEGSSSGLDRLTELFKSGVARKAHPTMEHIMPMAVAVGASTEFTPKEVEGAAEVEKVDASDFKGSRMYTAYTSSLAWGIFKFGHL